MRETNEEDINCLKLFDLYLGAGQTFFNFYYLKKKELSGSIAAAALMRTPFFLISWSDSSKKQKIRNVADACASLLQSISSGYNYVTGKNENFFRYMSAVPNSIIHLMSFSDMVEKDTKEQKILSLAKIFSNAVYAKGVGDKKIPYTVVWNICDLVSSIYSFIKK